MDAGWADVRGYGRSTGHPQGGYYRWDTDGRGLGGCARIWQKYRSSAGWVLPVGHGWTRIGRMCADMAEVPVIRRVGITGGTRMHADWADVRGYGRSTGHPQGGYYRWDTDGRGLGGCARIWQKYRSSAGWVLPVGHGWTRVGRMCADRSEALVIRT